MTPGGRKEPGGKASVVKAHIRKGWCSLSPSSQATARFFLFLRRSLVLALSPRPFFFFFLNECHWSIIYKWQNEPILRVLFVEF